MAPVIAVAALWLVFAGTHVALGCAPMRSRIVQRLGDLGFTVLFYLVAAASFAGLVGYYVEHRFEGPPGLALATSTSLRWLLMMAVAAGVMLMVAGLRDYPRSPMALFGQSIRAPVGVARITRHPFFAGTTLLALAHSLMAAHLVGTVFFGALAFFAAAGAVHQDRKLLARRGGAYAGYLAQTSAVPFTAILAGRQRLVWRELPFGTFAVGFLMTLGLRYGHASLLADGGAWFIAAVLGGALFAGLGAWRRSRRLAARRAGSAAAVADPAGVHLPDGSSGRR